MVRVEFEAGVMRRVRAVMDAGGTFA